MTEYKTCRICYESKELSCFSINRSRLDGRHYNCKPCDAAKVRKWQRDNPIKLRLKQVKWIAKNGDRYRAYGRARYHADREKHLQDRKAYRAANIEKISLREAVYAANNREKRLEYGREWRRANHARCIALAVKRETVKRRATPSWLPKAQLEEMAAFYETATRLTRETGIRHDVDHIVPLRGREVCGLHVPWNLRVIPHDENVSKFNRLVPELAEAT